MAEGYVKLWRAIEEWEWYHDLPCRVLFLHLLIKVNRKPGTFQGTPINPGEHATSIPKLASGTGLSDQQVRTALSKLKSTGDIDDRSTAAFRVVTLRNWGHWQDSEKDQQANNRPSNRLSTGINDPDQQENNSNLRREEGRSTPNGVLVAIGNEQGEMILVENPTLFGPEGDPARTSIMRNSPVADWEIFRLVPEAVQLIGLGVDVAHYHGALLRWSDTKNRTVRTAQGWVSTVINAMHRDKNEGKLRMLNGQSDKDERLMKFLKIGSKR